jgi:hypothetical protein
MFNYQIREGGGAPAQISRVRLRYSGSAFKMYMFQAKSNSRFWKKWFLPFLQPLEVGIGGLPVQRGWQKRYFRAVSSPARIFWLFPLFTSSTGVIRSLLAGVKVSGIHSVGKLVPKLPKVHYVFVCGMSPPKTFFKWHLSGRNSASRGCYEVILGLGWMELPPGCWGGSRWGQKL